MNISSINFNTNFSSNAVTFKPTHNIASDNNWEFKSNPEILKYGNLYKIHPDILKKNISKHRISLLKPIQSNQEYDNSLKKLYDTTYYACGRSRDFFDDNGYEDTDNNLKALALYCGLNDRSRLINSWLSGRKKGIFKNLSDNDIANGIRSFEYSLKALDKKFGKFEGRVYRRGYFNPNSDTQYYSASKDINSANAFCHHGETTDFKPFSIIRVKNGHKICDFQKYVNSLVSNKFERKEHEILLDRKSKFRKVPSEEYSKEDIKEIKTVLRKMYGYMPWQLNLDKLDKKIGLYSKFMVWEEI